MNAPIPAAVLDLLDPANRQPVDVDQLRSQLLAAATASPSAIPALKAALREASEVGSLSAELGQALAGELDAIGAHAPTLHRPPAEANDSSGSAATLHRPPNSPASGAPPDSSVSPLFAKTEVMTERRVAALGVADPSGADLTRFEPGAMIKGRFVLKERIGFGGMGIVFSAIDRRKTEARDPNPLVAIKILNAELARHPNALMALQREARKAQTLAHPNVTTVFDFDRDGDRVFMSMELLRGRPLDAVLRETNGVGIGREAALPILRGVAEGLAYAHRKGIVHSDLKPGNVFLTEEGTAKILDFGIARAVPSTSPNEPKDLYDAHAFRAYTEAYATAEMIGGADPHPADDVYALGVIAYQLLTGVHPYQQSSVPKAREQGLRAVQPRGLRRREWRVLERSLAFERGLRPRDAGEFMAQFFGVTRPQKALIAAILVLGVFAAYATYRNYQQSGPAVAFETLPAQTQQEFTAFMDDGERLWRFYEQDNNLLALQEAVEQFANAYALHPGNRQAVSALQRVADAALNATADRPQQRREFARALAQRSEYLASYPPVMNASK